MPVPTQQMSRTPQMRLPTTREVVKLQTDFTKATHITGIGDALPRGRPNHSPPPPGTGAARGEKYFMP
ncbi:hypothetical protein [Streptomyces sp. NPDC050528]|uniref:hypothetical protein n=1 Tax=Streptomyces sp. NPDC050528 TaxID=3365623 RepID=UPI003793F362